MSFLNLSPIKNAIANFTEFVDNKDYKDYENLKIRWKCYHLGMKVFLAYFEVGKDLSPKIKVNVEELNESFAHVKDDLDGCVWYFGKMFNKNYSIWNLKIRSGIQFVIDWHSLKRQDEIKYTVGIDYGVDEKMGKWIENIEYSEKYKHYVRPQNITRKHWWWGKLFKFEELDSDSDSD
jgi:hypothetical protein